MTFFRELWRRQQFEKGLGGDMSVRKELDGPTPHPEPTDASESQPATSTHACGDWAGAHLRANGLKERA